MQQIAKFHPATLIDLHEWSTLSRNEIRPFLARFWVEPLGSKYPLLRVYEAVLGLSPTGEIEEKIPGQNIRELLQSSRAVLRDALADGHGRDRGHEAWRASAPALRHRRHERARDPLRA